MIDSFLLFLHFYFPTRPTVSTMFLNLVVVVGSVGSFRYRPGSTVGNLAARSVTRGGIRLCVSYGDFSCKRMEKWGEDTVVLKGINR